MKLSELKTLLEKATPDWTLSYLEYGEEVFYGGAGAGMYCIESDGPPFLECNMAGHGEGTEAEKEAALANATLACSAPDLARLLVEAVGLLEKMLYQLSKVNCYQGCDGGTCVDGNGDPYECQWCGEQRQVRTFLKDMEVGQARPAESEVDNEC